MTGDLPEADGCSPWRQWPRVRARRGRRSGPLALLTIAAASCAALLPAVAPAFQIQSNPNASLDGKTVMSPGAELIRTTEPEGGKPIGPGSDVVRHVLLQNRTKQATTYELDVAQVVGSDAETVVEVRHGVREQAAAWAQIERHSVTLKPGDTATIKVTVNIPKQVKPGSKAFAVTATQRSAPTGTEGAGITPIFRQVAIFVVDLPGDAPTKGKISNTSIASSRDVLNQTRAGEGVRGSIARWIRAREIFIGDHTIAATLQYDNEGERLLRPKGNVQVKDAFGRVAGTYQIKAFTIYPDGQNLTTIEMRKLPSLGIFTARVTLESEAGRDSEKLGTFTLLPAWLGWALLALLLYLVYQVVQWFLSRRRLARWADEDLEDDEDDEDDFPYEEDAEDTFEAGAQPPPHAGSGQ